MKWAERRLWEVRPRLSIALACRIACPVVIVGVDEWAWRKRQEYRTSVANLNLHVLVDVLPGCAAESVSERFKQYLGNRDDLR